MYLMEKKSCTEKVCKRCGWCCTSLGKEIGLNREEDKKLKKLVFEGSGVIYLRSLNRYFLAISPETAEKLKKRAKNMGIKADIRPNKLIYDKSTGKVIIYDYYINHKKCPFYKGNSCLVYKDRPAACKKFPNIDHSYSKEVAAFVKKNRISFSGLRYEYASRKCADFLKNFIEER